MKTTTTSAKPQYRQLPVQLTQEERMARAMTAAEKQGRYGEVEEHKKSVSSECGRELKELRSEIEDLQRAVRTGTERQDVQIETRRNEERRTVETVRLDTAEIVDTRPMTIEERQGKLFGIDGGKKDSKAAKPGSKGAGPTAAANDAKDAKGGDAKSAKPSTRRTVAAGARSTKSGRRPEKPGKPGKPGDTKPSA